MAPRRSTRAISKKASAAIAAPKSPASAAGKKRKNPPNVSRKKRTGLKGAPSTKAPLGVVDPESKIEGTIVVTDSLEPCDAMLVLVDPAKHMDKFFVLQLIAKADDKGYVVYSRWGRTGTAGQALEQDFDGLEDAETCFRDKFRQKSGLDWEDREAPTVGEKYRFVIQDFASKSSGYATAKWQYWVDDGVDDKPTAWYDYTPEGSAQVEQLFMENSHNPNLMNRLVQSGAWLYNVDLAQMIQTNQTHPNHTSRRIRRCSKDEDMDNAPPLPIVCSASMVSVAQVAPPPVTSSTHLGPTPQPSPVKSAATAVTAALTPVKSDPDLVKSDPDLVKSDPDLVKSFTPNKPSKGSHPVDADIDLHGGDASAYAVVQNEEGVWYDAVLNQCNIAGNNNKYYRIQMVKECASGTYYVWQKWGRVGERAMASTSALKGPYSSPADGALKEFSKKYRDKTGNKFDAEEFVAKKGKYVPIEIDNDAQVDGEFKSPRAKEGVEYHPSKLDPKTKELIEVLFSKDMRDEALHHFNLDLKKLPLGVPSEQQIQHGISVLNEIESKLNGDTIAESFDELSSRFYTALPHSFGRTRPPVISAKDSLQSRYDMCNILLDMYSTTETIRKIEAAVPKKKQLPYPADQHYDSLNAELKVVGRQSGEYEMIAEHFNKTKGHHSQAQVLDVWSVDRQGEAERYRNFDSINDRCLLWHGTNVAVVAPIITSGLRIMPHSGGRLGSGIYLASLQEKSAQYTSGYGSKFACMFLCEAALGKKHPVTQDGAHASSLKKAPPGFDSVHAVGRLSPKIWKPMEIDGRKVMIPQSAAEPSGTQSSFDHDEFLVYEEGQIRLRYAVTVKLY